MNFRDQNDQSFPHQFYRQPTLQEANSGASFHSQTHSSCCSLHHYDPGNESKQTNNTSMIHVPNFDAQLLPDLMRAIDSMGDITDKPIFSEASLFKNDSYQRTVEQNRFASCIKSASAPAQLKNASRFILPSVASNNAAIPLKSMKNADWDFVSTPFFDMSKTQCSANHSRIIPIPNNGKITPYNQRASMDFAWPKPEVTPKRTPTWQELSSQINKFAQENAITSGWNVFVSKKKATKDSTLYDISVQEPKLFIKVRNAYKRSLKSQKRLEEWDKKMGLKRCHSRTMTKSSISRKQLLDIMNDIQRMQRKRDNETLSS
mmetsp:Transcript_161/g.408  ORF Transcript_161/g.408 Transcript_161/m.408 type:complete len:318 (-) Transcript_161:152-1105(-)